QLLADADVDDALGEVALRPAEEPCGDLGVHQCGREVLGEQIGDGACELRARVEAHSHGGHAASSSYSRMVATTAFGTPVPRALRARSSASWSRPSTVSTSQPSVAKRAAIRPGTAYDVERLSTTTTVSASRPKAAATSSASWFVPSSSSASP